MGHPWLTFVLALGWALLPRAASAQAAETRTAGDQSPDLADVVEHLISRTHAFRHQEGRPPVAPNPQLTAAAQDFAAFMARTGQFSHTADGQTPDARAKAHGYDPCLIAENIASQHHPARTSRPRRWRRDFSRAGSSRPTTGRTCSTRR